MARPLRIEHPGAVYHVYNRGVNRGDVFFCDSDRILFLALLAECVRRFGWIIHQFTLMTNHFHLAIETLEPTLSRGMKWLEGAYAQAINRRYDRVGPLFQDRKGVWPAPGSPCLRQFFSEQVVLTGTEVYFRLTILLPVLLYRNESNDIQRM